MSFGGSLDDTVGWDRQGLQGFAVWSINNSSLDRGPSGSAPGLPSNPDFLRQAMGDPVGTLSSLDLMRTTKFSLWIPVNKAGEVGCHLSIWLPPQSAYHQMQSTTPSTQMPQMLGLQWVLANGVPQGMDGAPQEAKCEPQHCRHAWNAGEGKDGMRKRDQQLAASSNHVVVHMLKV